MNVRIDPHTLQRATERGTNEAEIREVIATGLRISAKHGREGSAKVFRFHQMRGGRYYEHKRVEVIYTVEAGTVITVTVYVFYGTWDETDAHHL